MDQTISKWSTDFSGMARSEAMIQGSHYRFTLLTTQLLRIEYSEEGKFEDRPTQSVINREFEVPQYRIVEDDNKLEIITEHMHVYYKKGPLTANSLYIDVKGNFSAHGSRWYYGTWAPNLGGTARTLDDAKGAIPLEDGVTAKNGFSVIDDSKSQLLTEDGWVEPREKGVVDLYFFGYGREYFKCMHDFFKLTGSTPLLPRYALGNWWSRYWRYDEQEYMQLMDKFRKEDIPFSVAVIDMDWHIVDIDPKYGSGWTGYSWNKDLFPDPERFMKGLHNDNYKVTLNLHPADGVRAHEEMYEPMAKELGIDYHNEDPIPFDIASPTFLDAYFKYLHHPLEEQGVDFWWIDWQQGNTTAVEGLDPLWMLNHYHFHDNQRNGNEGIIFSRYAGVGSHRYPVGFSGDTHITWDAYRFQPYFTATASNIGYCWWSHDIGGHMLGERDDELSARWVQFGVFSPIMRLHSSCSPFTGKEPWRYTPEAQQTIKEHLRLRHQLIPYIYTMNWRLNKDLVPFITPMYYHHPMEEASYEVPNQYFFGSELMVCSITEPMNPEIARAAVKVWLPEGKWIDFYDGRVYEGGRTLKMFRGIDHQVVLAKAGAIVPMAKHIKHENTTDNPKDLEIVVFPGQSGSFTLYEDDCLTSMTYSEAQQSCFRLSPAEGNTTSIPQQRNITVMYRGVNDVTDIDVKVDGKQVAFARTYDQANKTVKVEVQEYDITSTLEVSLSVEGLLNQNTDYMEQVYKLLDQAQMSYAVKDQIYYKIRDAKDQQKLLGELRCLDLEADLFDALLEIIS